MVIDHQTPIIRFKNARLIKNGQLILDDLWIQNGKIIDPMPIFYDNRKCAFVTIECHQMIIAPGYIDLQINGGFGHDFSTTGTNIETALKIVSTNLVKYGVTSFCPTLITQPTENYKQLLPRMKRGPVDNGATILGIHLEGPFISKQKKGAHQEQFIQENIESIEQIEQFYHDLSNVSIITLAPELDKNNVVGQLTEKGFVVSLGHSDANLEQSEKAFQNGAKMITHLFNGMLLFHHRDPGLIGLLTTESKRQIFFGVIADGVHLHYSALRLAFFANRSGMVLVSDAMSAAGLDHGIHKIGSQMVQIKNNKATLLDTNILSGSIVTMDFCVRYLREKVGCSIVEAIECATLHPAQVLSIQHQKGTLNFGSDADFIILNDKLEVLATFINSKCVYVNDEKNIINLNELNQIKFD